MLASFPANMVNHDSPPLENPSNRFCLFGTRSSALLFHFANAPLLPLVRQKLALQFPEEATAMMSFCMVAAQGVMLPIAILVGRNADGLGRRPIFLMAFAILPIRAALYTLSDNAFWLVGVQMLDGVGAGIYGALTPLVIAETTATRPNTATGARAAKHAG